MDKDATDEQKFIIDSIVKFFTGDETATYEKHKETYFETAQLFGQAIRKVKPEKLERDTVRPAICRSSWALGEDFVLFTGM